MSNSTIIRSPRDKNNPWRMINRFTMEDRRLSFEARGALAFILVKPDDWQVSVTNLMNEGDIGREKAYRILNEWIEFGYCERSEHRHQGKITGYTYTIHESPLTALPLTALPLTALPLAENQHHTKEEVITKKDKELINSSRAEKSTPPTSPDTQSIIAAYIEVRGKNGINYGKEGTFAKRIVKDGYNAEQVKGCYLWMKNDPWWEDKPVTLDVIFKHLPEYTAWVERTITPIKAKEDTVIDIDWSAI